MVGGGEVVGLEDGVEFLEVLPMERDERLRFEDALVPLEFVAVRQSPYEFGLRRAKKVSECAESNFPRSGR